MHFAYFCTAKARTMNLTPTIIQDFKSGNLESFYSEAYADLLTYAERQLGEHHALLAEDLVQDAIFQSYRQRDAIADGQQWKTFLFRLIHNAAVSLRRSHSAEQRYLSHEQYAASQQVGEADFVRSLVQQETLERLFGAIRSLPHRYQNIFQLSFEQGLRNPEIAELLKISVRAVVKQKTRLLQLLRQRL